MKLNGWQRLWVLLSVLWVLGSVLSSVLSVLDLGVLSLAEDATGKTFLFMGILFAPPLALYILGFAVEWVIWGFRNQGT